MPQHPAGFTPDPEPDLSGFTPDPEPASTFDPETASDLERQVLGLPPKGGYTSMWDTAASYIPSPVKSAWESIWNPLTEAPTRAGKAISDYLDPNQYTNPVARFAAEYPHALGTVLSGLTSPGNLALGAATGGAGLASRAGVQSALPVVAPRIAQGLTTAGRAIGGAEVAHGAQTVADPRTSMLEKGMGVLEATMGGLGTRAPKPRAAAAAPIDAPPTTIRTPSGQTTITGAPQSVIDDVYGPQKAAPIDPNFNQGMGDAELAGSVPYQRAPGEVVPNEGVVPPPATLDPQAQAVRDQTARPTHIPEPAPSSFGADRWDEIQQKMAQGIADENDLIDLEVIRRVSGSGKITPAPKPPAPTPAQQFEASVLGDVKPPNLDANLARLSPEGLAEMNALYDQPTPAMTPAQAAEGMAQPPTDVRAFLESLKQGEAPPTRKTTLEMEGGKTVELEFMDPKTGETRPASQSRPGDVPVVPPGTPPVPRRAGGRMGAPNLGLPTQAIPEGMPVKPPDTVYHGTPNLSGVVEEGFDLAKGKGNQLPGMVHFAESPARAAKFAGEAPGAGTVPAGLNVKNPIDLVNPNKADIFKLKNGLAGKDLDEFVELYNTYKGNIPDYELMKFIQRMTPEQFKATGFDAVRYHEGSSIVPGSKEASVAWAVPDPQQVKMRGATEPAIPAVVGKSVPPEVKGKVGGEVPPTTAADTQRLPKGLQGAKPRFNIGADSYFPNFADDLDKALYIIGQKVKSKADDQYLRFVMEQTGLTEVAARNAGAQIKAAIKKAAQDAPETGKIDIPPIMRERLAAQGGGGGTVPPTKPPVATGGAPEPPPRTPKEYLEGQPKISTGPIKPENVRPVAEEVTTSLANRLKKAVDEAGTPNALAADDIRNLMDEAAQVLNNMPDGPAKQGLVRQILSANKAVLTSWDLSAPGRQGKAFLFNKAYWTSWDDMFKAWGSQKGADLVNQSIVDHPSGYFTKPVSESGKVGKSFAEKVGLDLAATEEVFTSVIDRAAGKIPLVGRSSRAHTAFLNKLRSDQFVAFMDQAKAAGKNPETNIELAKSYAKFINDATGRGSVNIGQWKLERNLGVLNDTFFAPKNMAGQIRTWNGVLNPVKYYNYDPVLRKQALKSLMAIGGVGMGVGALAKAAGANVSYDPFSSDFQKIKVGDTRIDLFGGYQQFPVAAMKFIAGLNTPTTGKNEGQTQDLTAGRFGQSRETVAERFFTNRLSPLGSFVYSWMSGREFDGKPFEVKRALYERVFPIAAKDIMELAQEDPALAVVLAPLMVTGFAGSQVYGGR